MSKANYAAALNALLKDELVLLAEIAEIETVGARSPKSAIADALMSVPARELFESVPRDRLRVVADALGLLAAGKKPELIDRIAAVCGVGRSAPHEPEQAIEYPTDFDGNSRLAAVLPYAFTKAYLYEFARERLDDPDVRSNWTSQRIAEEIAKYEPAQVFQRMLAGDVRHLAQWFELDTTGGKDQVVERLIRRLRATAGSIPGNTDGSRTGDTNNQHVQSGPALGGMRTVNERYRVRCVLGEGGFGRAELAWDPNRNLEVVLKYSHAARFDELQRELRSVLTLRHDNICACYDIETDRRTQQPFLVLEYGGNSLSSQIESGTCADVKFALELARQVGAALDYAHERGVFHNDVSPANILVAQSGRGLRLRLTDFGISSLTRQATRTVVASHPGYMHAIFSSPEMLGADQLTRRSDQFSLALVVCAVLEGRVFETRYRRRDFARLTAAQNSALARALRTNEADRFPNCSAFADAFGA